MMAGHEVCEKHCLRSIRIREIIKLGHSSNGQIYSFVLPFHPPSFGKKGGVQGGGGDFLNKSIFEHPNHNQAFQSCRSTEHCCTQVLYSSNYTLGQRSHPNHHQTSLLDLAESIHVIIIATSILILSCMYLSIVVTGFNW